MKGLHKRTFSAWEPIDEQAKKIFKRFKVGELADLEYTATRNIKFHRKFFAVINLTFQNQDDYDNDLFFRKALTIEAGYYHWIPLMDGTKTKEADEIKFTKMDDLVFEDLYSKVFDICLKILGCKSEELELELLKFS